MRTLALLVLMVVMLAPQSICEAQQQPGARPRVPVLVAVDPRLDRDGTTPFQLTRIAGNSPHDIILLASNADASVLTQAIDALMAVHRQSGSEPSSSARFRVRQPQRQRVLPWAARILRDVHGAALREIPGVGRLRAVQIWLPRATGRG